MKTVVILTGSELRHTYFRKKIALSENINVLKTYCESVDNLIENGTKEESWVRRKKHLLAREQSEIDFFSLFVENTPDHSNPAFLHKGEVNNPNIVNEIMNLLPEVIVVYGSSIIKEPILSAFPNKIINVHLGLSPYFRGAATNFWPFIENLVECIGVTFMYIDAGIDTGRIIHQIRPEINFFDTPSSIGNRLIKQMTAVVHKLIINYEKLATMPPPTFKNFNRFYRKKDYSEEAVELVYKNFCNGMIENYLNNKVIRDSCFPIVTNPAIT